VTGGGGNGGDAAEGRTARWRGEELRRAKADRAVHRNCHKRRGRPAHLLARLLGCSSTAKRRQRREIEGGGAG
jgi:hypothetical protein